VLGRAVPTKGAAAVWRAGCSAPRLRSDERLLMTPRAQCSADAEGLSARGRRGVPR